MPHGSLKLMPGVDQNRTPALNEAAISESNLIRFVPDRQGTALPQKIGGWTKYFNQPMTAIVRALWAWADTNSEHYLAVGAEDGVYSISGDALATRQLATRSPQYYVVNPAVSCDTTSGSNEVIIDDTGSNVSNYDSIYIATHISVGGLILFGFYTCEALSANSYSVFARNIIGLPINATSTVTNGGAVASFTTAAGSSSVSVTLADHGFSVGSTYPILVPTTVGGITLYGNYIVREVTSTSVFVISAENKATSSATASINGGNAQITYYIGQSALPPSTGYGSGGYGAGGYGTGVTTGGAIYSTTAASCVGTTATVTFAGNYLASVGSLITIAGVTPSGYNGTWTVTASTSGATSTVSFTVPSTLGAQTVAGTISIVPNRAFTTSAASCVGTTATVSINGNILIPVGSAIQIFGVVPTGYNTETGSSWIVTASTAGATSTVSFTVPSTLGVQTTAGVLMVNTWGFGSATDWSLDNWGEYLIACPRGGEIYYWNPTDGGENAVVVPNAPKVNEGCFVAMPERQIIAYGSTFTGIQDPLLVRWCDISNFTSWVGTVANQAGSFRIPKGSKIVGALQGPQQGLIWTDLGVWSMQYVNLPLVWSFNEIGSGCGLIGRRAATTLAGQVYWMSQSQFYMLSGGGVQPIPCPIWDVIFQDIDTDYVDNIRCGTNARFGEVTWYYPTTGSNGVPTKYVKLNAALGSWDFGTLTRTAWIDQSVLGAPIGASGSNYIYQHETSTDADGQAINAYIQTGWFALDEGDVKTFVDQVWPDMKWGYYGGSQNATVRITFFTADYPGGTVRTHGPYLVNQSTSYVTPRLRGRLVSIRIESNDVGSFWRLGNIRYRLQPDGKF